MASAPAVPAKQSWLKRFGHDIGVTLGFVAKVGEPIVNEAATIATIALPQFAVEIAAADNLATRILEQVKTTEAAYVAVGQGTNGAAKLQAVISATQSEINQWVKNNFPGAGPISTESQAGLVNAIVAIANDVDPALALVAPTSSALAAAAAAGSAVASAVKTA